MQPRSNNQQEVDWGEKKDMSFERKGWRMVRESAGSKAITGSEEEVCVHPSWRHVQTSVRMKGEKAGPGSCECGGLVAKSCLTLLTPRTVAHQPPLSIGFPGQEYWRGLPFPSPGDLPNLGVEPGSPTLQADSLPTEPPGKPLVRINWLKHQVSPVSSRPIVEGRLGLYWKATSQGLDCPFLF